MLWFNIFFQRKTFNTNNIISLLLLLLLRFLRINFK